MSDTDLTVVNPVACAACRARKCKCDRTLPTCSQCLKSAISCVYPESSKRGFPEGYLAGLERRLAETECALLEALSGSVIGAAERLEYRTRAEKQSKTAKSQEWLELPISSRADLGMWLARKQVDIDIHSNELDVYTETHNAELPRPNLDSHSSPARIQDQARQPPFATPETPAVLAMATSPPVPGRSSVNTSPVGNFAQEVNERNTPRATQLSKDKSWRFF